jgi:hypothetical protein
MSIQGARKSAREEATPSLGASRLSFFVAA